MTFLFVYKWITESLLFNVKVGGNQVNIGIMKNDERVYFWHRIKF